METINKFLYKLHIEAPFFGSLMNKFVVQESKRCPTMGVLPRDGKVYFYYNPDFLAMLTFEQALAILEHEVLHVSHEHFKRDERAGDMWLVDGINIRVCNIAEDMEINQFIPNIPTEGPCAGVSVPNGWEKERAWEYYYKMLIDNKDKIQMSRETEEDKDKDDNSEEQGQGSQDEQSEGSDDQQQGEQGQGSQGDQSDGQQQGSQGQQSDGSGNPQQGQDSKGQGSQSQNQQSNSGDSSPQDGNGDMKSTSSGKGNERIKMKIGDQEMFIDPDKHDWHDKYEHDPITEKVVREMVKEAIQEAKDRGNMPGNLEEKINLVHTKKERWDRVLKRRVWNKLSQDVYFKFRRDRRTKLFPAKYKKPDIEILIGVDSSGSVSSVELSKFLNSIRNIWKSHPSTFKILVCDTNINEIEYKGETNINIFGRGGTDMTMVLDWIAEHKKHKNDTLILFTDGYSPWYNDDHPKKRKTGETIIVYTPEHTKFNCKWCKHIEINTL